MTYREHPDAHLRAEADALRAENARLLARGPAQRLYDRLSVTECVAFPILIGGWPLACVALFVAAHYGGLTAAIATGVVGAAWWAWALFYALRD